MNVSPVRVHVTLGNISLVARGSNLLGDYVKDDVPMPVSRFPMYLWIIDAIVATVPSPEKE
jgi:hypothetical protein